MKDRRFIIIVIGFASTLVFELFKEGIRRDWFLGTDIIYPDIPDTWGEMAGKHALTLQHYLDDIAEHLHVIALYLYIFINTVEKRIFGILMILSVFSLFNYLYNYHEPLIWKFDMNYLILFFMIIFLGSKGGKKWWK